MSPRSRNEARPTRPGRPRARRAAVILAVVAVVAEGFVTAAASQALTLAPRAAQTARAAAGLNVTIVAAPGQTLIEGIDQPTGVDVDGVGCTPC